MQMQEVQLAPPILNFDQTFFKEKTTVQLELGLKNVAIHYTLDGSEPTRNSPRYEQPILIKKTTMLTTKAFHECCQASEIVVAHFFKVSDKNQTKSAILTHIPHENYLGNGTNTLMDFQKGTTDFKDGKWLGFTGEDVELVIEFSKKKALNEVVISTLGNTDAWIFLPVAVEVYQSKKGRKFKQIGAKAGFKNEKNTQSGFKFLTLNLFSKRQRFYKIIIKNQGLIPTWHVGKGPAAWLFVDEILLY